VKLILGVEKIDNESEIIDKSGAKILKIDFFRIVVLV